MDFFRLIFGGVVAIAGAILVGIAKYTHIPLLILGIALFILGLIIFFNEKEDKIEKIKYDGGKK